MCHDIKTSLRLKPFDDMLLRSLGEQTRPSKCDFANQTVVSSVEDAGYWSERLEKYHYLILSRPRRLALDTTFVQ